MYGGLHNVITFMKKDTHMVKILKSQNRRKCHQPKKSEKIHQNYQATRETITKSFVDKCKNTIPLC